MKNFLKKKHGTIFVETSPPPSPTSTVWNPSQNTVVLRLEKTIALRCSQRAYIFTKTNGRGLENTCVCISFMLFVRAAAWATFLFSGIKNAVDAVRTCVREILVSVRIKGDDDDYFQAGRRPFCKLRKGRMPKCLPFLFENVKID